jgi:hypothetical protein
MRIHVDEILAAGLDIAGYDYDRQFKIKKRKTRVEYFVSFYGLAPETYEEVFEGLCNSQAAQDVLGKPPVLSELLMMANWCKEGLTFNSLGGKFKINPNTANKWCWKYAKAIGELYESKVK